MVVQSEIISTNYGDVVRLVLRLNGGYIYVAYKTGDKPGRKEAVCHVEH
jgi:hypothetical protein